MATAKLYRATDMLDVDFYYGVIEEYSSSKIYITDGYASTTYKGKFSYDYYGDVFGTLQSLVGKLGSSTVYEVSDINRSAYTFSQYAYYGDAEGAMEYVLSGSDRLEGSAYSDRLFGFGGNDTLLGNGGNDQLYGESGNDRLYGGTGTDRLDGGTGSDYLAGGSGSDTYIVNSTGDSVVEKAGEGTDHVYSSASHSLSASVEKLTLTGNSATSGTGNSLANTITGNASGNILKGEDGNDVLKGNGGADRLLGGFNKDVLYGGTGADDFVFSSAKSAGLWEGRDVIKDFNRGFDDIDVSLIDAVTGRSGNQSFEFIGGKSFSKEAGELRFSGGVVSGDVNGDGRTDFQIEVAGVSALGEFDFIL